MKLAQYSNIYQVKLANDHYVYLCWLAECYFGVLDYMSVDKLESVNLDIGFKFYKACKENGITRKIWHKVGHVDLAQSGIFMPDLAIYREWAAAERVESSMVMRQGNLTRVTTSEYLALLAQGYIYGYFDDYRKFEQWLVNNFHSGQAVLIKDKHNASQ